MKQKPSGRASSSEQTIRDIKRKTRKQYSAEEKIRIVLDGLRGEDSIAEGYHTENQRDRKGSGVHLRAPNRRCGAS